MTHPIVSRDEWLEARKAHIADEKAFTKARDALSARRRTLPWVRIEKEYRFQTCEGEKTLGDLFGSNSQLIVQHFMFGPDWEAGCTSCSFWADGFDGFIEHLAHRDAMLVAVSNAPLAKLDAYKERMGWSFPWVSSEGNDFNQDFAVTFKKDELESGNPVYNFGSSSFPVTEAPGISIFHKPDTDTVVHSYSTYGRGLDMMNAAYHYMDLLPKGRDEGDGNMAWLRRRDEYMD